MVERKWEVRGGKNGDYNVEEIWRRIFMVGRAAVREKLVRRSVERKTYDIKR